MNSYACADFFGRNRQLPGWVFRVFRRFCNREMFTAVRSQFEFQRSSIFLCIVRQSKVENDGLAVNAIIRSIVRSAKCICRTGFAMISNLIAGIWNNRVACFQSVRNIDAPIGYIGSSSCRVRTAFQINNCHSRIVNNIDSQGTYISICIPVKRYGDLELSSGIRFCCTH